MQNETPVTDYKKTKGLIYFARMLDKIRLYAAGRLAPGYFVGVEDPTFFDPGFWELIMMSWRNGQWSAARTKKSWSGALRMAGDRPKKKSKSGMRSWSNAVGAMKAAPIWRRRRSEMA